MKRALAVFALAGIAGAASAQSTIHWYWVVGDTGNNDGVISPGENATLNLYAQFSDPGLHYGGSILDIIGSGNLDTGTYVSRGANPKLKALSDGDGILQPNNDIKTADTFQLPEFFNPNIDKSNPIWVYGMEWMPNDYTARTVSGSTTHLNHSIYVDTFGTSKEFSPTIEGFKFDVVPAPASLALVGLGGLVAARRRRA
ncbi:MAG TPA: PEP-CTERM sorting domain-containing protein [Phycisphaerales bacterium]|nr:PEP-CTERM sorting domain-containing protein [Phycisphaerales bacterium]